MIDPPGIEEVSRRCQDCLKTVLQEGKNTNMNAIKHTTQPKINILSSQNHLSTKILSTMIPKTHTHQTSLTNFIFQKQVKTV